MSLVSFIFSSTVLSCAGVLSYLVFRMTKPSFQLRRGFLWMVVALSLLIPLVSQIRQESASKNEPLHTSVEDFCHCDHPGAGEMIHFQASRLNDLLLEYRVHVYVLFAALLLMALFRFGLNFWRLSRLAKLYMVGDIEVDFQRVGLIRDFPGIAAGAVWLGRPFLLWDSRLDALSEDEKRFVVLHELSHLRQWNSLERLFLGILHALWLFNPAFYFIRRELSLLSEYTADAFVVSKTNHPKAYALLLLKIKSDEKWGLISFFKGGELKKRISKVLDPPIVFHRPAHVAIAITCVLLLPMEIAASSWIEEGMKEIAVYALISEVNAQTGEEDFCRKCAFEQSDSCY